jgi:hypothetical protein
VCVAVTRSQRVLYLGHDLSVDTELHYNCQPYVTYVHHPAEGARTSTTQPRVCANSFCWRRGLRSEGMARCCSRRSSATCATRACAASSASQGRTLSAFGARRGTRRRRSHSNRSGGRCCAIRLARRSSRPSGSSAACTTAKALRAVETLHLYRQHPQCLTRYTLSYAARQRGACLVWALCENV